MLKNVIEALGTCKVADACGVTPGCVSHWKRNGHLPGRGTKVDRRGDMYERRIADLAGITLADLREWIESGEKRAA